LFNLKINNLNIQVKNKLLTVKVMEVFLGEIYNDFFKRCFLKIIVLASFLIPKISLIYCYKSHKVVPTNLIMLFLRMYIIDIIKN
jgi:hypothetical protein